MAIKKLIPIMKKALLKVVVHNDSLIRNFSLTV